MKTIKEGEWNLFIYLFFNIGLHNKMIHFKFNEKKVTQAAAFLIKQAGNTLNYTKLIKLLYLADRKALKTWERTISGDSYYSMKKGPVLSNTLDLIHYPDNSFWHKHITTSGYDVILSADPGTTLLQPNEIKFLKSLSDEHKNRDWKAMIKYCHDCCDEWQHPGDTAIPLQVEDILRTLNKTAREIEIIEDDVSTLNYAKKIFQVA
jgi:hypothetical protein